MGGPRVTDGRNQPPTCRRRQAVALGTIAILVLCSSCATLTDHGQPLVPTRYQVRTGPFIIFSNFPMTDDPPAVRCLQALERDMKKHLDFRPRVDDDLVEIYVLDDREAFAHFLKFYYPELPPRRAFFLAQGQERVVYTYSSPRLEEDLRHEATHALLRGSFGDLPLWLDEGLAEYFETDLGQPGAEHDRIEHFTADLTGGWSPSLPRLEALSDIRQMTPRDYREAWAWVHLLLNSSTDEKTILLTSLSDSSRVPPGPLRLEQKGATNERLLAHVKQVQSRSVARAPGSIDNGIRLQDKAADVAANNPPQRGLWRRLRTWIGF
jgi:Protein of unknown function (DUF1570)